MSWFPIVLAIAPSRKAPTYFITRSPKAFVRFFNSCSPIALLPIENQDSAIGISMIVPGMWISSAAGLVLQCHLHLMRATKCNDIAGKDRTVIGDYDMRGIPIDDSNRDPVEMVTVLLKHKRICALTGDRFHRQDDLILPFLNGNQ